jgi:hypothetical protein
MSLRLPCWNHVDDEFVPDPLFSLRTFLCFGMVVWLGFLQVKDADNV